jgi:hypothetical protein
MPLSKGCPFLIDPCRIKVKVQNVVKKVDPWILVLLDGTLNRTGTVICTHLVIPAELSKTLQIVN